MIRTSLALAAVWALFAAPALSSEGAEAAERFSPRAILVQTSQGEHEGFVDARSNQRALWLRQEEAGVVLASAVAWEDVVSIDAAGKEIEVADLRASLDDWASEEPSPFVEDPAPLTALASSRAADDACAATAQIPPRVRNLEILSVALANLDSDVEPDGLEITIAAIGVDGSPRPVRGNFTAELIVERRPRDSGDHEVGPLDRWNQAVEPGDFVDGVATYQLPFRNAAPEWEFDLLPDAILTVNLGAYGDGDFSASAPLLVRQFNPMRDNLQLMRNNRFAPSEFHTGKPFSRFGSEPGRWPYWPR